MIFRQPKRIVACSDGYQFICNGHPNRSKNGKSFDAVDGMFVKDAIKDLKYDETDGFHDANQGISCIMDVDRVPHEGFKEMWCFGFKKACRRISPFKPEEIEHFGDQFRAKIKHGDVFISEWGEREFFPDIPFGEVFPVYVRFRRPTEEEYKEYKLFTR